QDEKLFPWLSRWRCLMAGSLLYLVDQDNKPVKAEIRIAVEAASQGAFVSIEIWTKRILPLWRKPAALVCRSGWPQTTICCAPEATGAGLGRRLYAALFEAMAEKDIYHMLRVTRFRMRHRSDFTPVLISKRSGFSPKWHASSRRRGPNVPCTF